LDEQIMTTLTASEARTNLYRLIDESATTHEPLLITGKRNNAVLIAESDWTAIQERLHLLSAPGMHESISEGMQTPDTECAEQLEW
jgi:antitoxin YefM